MYFSRSFKKPTLLLLASITLAGCSVFEEQKDPPLPGERISVMALQKDLVVDVAKESLEDVEIPKVWENQFWPQAGGYPNHAMQNLALGNDEPLKRLWRADIGQGSSDQIPLTAQPIIVDGKAYTLDTDSQVSAFNVENGNLLWRKETRNPDDDPVISGGLAFSDNTLFVTNGYNTIIALNPQTGDEIWSKEISSPARAAPSILNGQVFIVTLDNKLIALDSKDGSFLWDYQGINEASGLVGAASPALDNDIVVTAFSSGEITALRTANGASIWSENLSNMRGISGLSGIADIRGFPIIDQGIIFAVSFAGKMIAVDQRTGGLIWSRDISSTETPWVAGNYIYVLTSNNQLVALMRKTGAIRWVTDLPRFDDSDPIHFSGPIMANGKLIVVSSEGNIIELSAQDGSIISELDTKFKYLTTPVIAGGTLYLLAENGFLNAYK